MKKIKNTWKRVVTRSMCVCIYRKKNRFTVATLIVIISVKCCEYAFVVLYVILVSLLKYLLNRVVLATTCIFGI